MSSKRFRPWLLLGIFAGAVYVAADRRPQPAAESPSVDRQAHPVGPGVDLTTEVADLLDGCLGLNVFPPSFKNWLRGKQDRYSSPIREGVKVGLIYLALFCGAPWLVFAIYKMYMDLIGSPGAAWHPSWPLFFLQIYGAFWSGWSTTTTQSTSAAVLSTLTTEIIPFLPPTAATRLSRELRRNFDSRRRRRSAWIVGALGCATAGIVVTRDLADLGMPAPVLEVAWWAIGWFFLYAPAAHVVLTAQFYRYFAVALSSCPGGLATLDPANSSLVLGIASVARRMLLFWLGIAVSIAVIFVFAVRDWSQVANLLSKNDFNGMAGAFKDVNFRHNGFVLVDVLVTDFFSILWGTIVFLRTEAAIRQAVDTSTRTTLRTLETEMGGLRLTGTEDGDRLAKLATLHGDVAKSGSYRSFLASGLSVFLPFLIPLVSLLLKGNGK